MNCPRRSQRCSSPSKVVYSFKKSHPPTPQGTDKEGSRVSWRNLARHQLAITIPKIRLLQGKGHPNWQARYRLTGDSELALMRSEAKHHCIVRDSTTDKRLPDTPTHKRKERAEARDRAKPSQTRKSHNFELSSTISTLFLTLQSSL